MNSGLINKYILSLNSKHIHIFPCEYFTQYTKLTTSLGGPSAIQTLNSEIHLKIFSKSALVFQLPQHTAAIVFYPRALFKNKKTATLRIPKIAITSEVGEMYADRIRKFIGHAWVSEAGGSIREDLYTGKTISNTNLPLVKIMRGNDDKPQTLQFLYLLYSFS